MERISKLIAASVLVFTITPVFSQNVTIEGKDVVQLILSRQAYEDALAILLDQEKVVRDLESKWKAVLQKYADKYGVSLEEYGLDLLNAEFKPLPEEIETDETPE